MGSINNMGGYFDAHVFMKNPRTCMCIYLLHLIIRLQSWSRGSKKELEEPYPCRELQHVISLVDGDLKGRQLSEKTGNYNS